jgi:hypothetical protein
MCIRDSEMLPVARRITRLTLFFRDCCLPLTAAVLCVTLYSADICKYLSCFSKGVSDHDSPSCRLISPVIMSSLELSQSHVTPSTNSNTVITPSPSLSALPTEIVNIIISPLTLSDICNLRLCSHACNARFTPTFTTYLHHQTVELTTRSLDKFLAVCSSRFSQYIESITVEASLWRLDDLKRRLRDKKRWVYTPLNEDGGNYRSTALDLTQEEIASYEADLEVFEELDRDQSELLRKGATTLLARAFRCLARQRIDIKLQAAVHQNRDEVRLAARGFSWDVEKRMVERMNGTFGVIMVALRVSDVVVERLEVFDLGKGGHVSLDELYNSWVNPSLESDRGTGFDNSTIPSALRRLKSLTLSISPPPYSNGDGIYRPSAPSDLHKRQLNSLRVLLTSCAQSLAHLDVRFRGFRTQHNPDSIALLSDLPVLPALSEVRLRNTAISAPSLLAFSETSPNLSTIGLHRVALCPMFPSNTQPVPYDRPAALAARGRRSPPTSEAFVPTVLPQFRHPHDSPDLRSWLPIFASLRHLQRLSLLDTSMLSIISHRPTSNVAAAPVTAPDLDDHINDDLEVDISSWLLSQVFITWPRPSTSCIAASDYRRQLYLEGCPEVTLTGKEIHALPRETLDAAGEIGWDEIGVDPNRGDSDTSAADDWTPVRYRIMKQHPRGSDNLYRWRRAVHKEYALF